MLAAPEVPGLVQNEAMQKKYINAYGKEWCLKKIPERDSNAVQASSHPGYATPSTAAGLSSDDSDSSSTEGPPTSVGRGVSGVKEVTSYLMSSEQANISIYLELESLFKGASSVFSDEARFTLRATSDRIAVSMMGPAGRGAAEEVEWRLSVPMPCSVEANKAVLKLRKGKLSVKVPKAVAAKSTLATSEVEEARLAARQQQFAHKAADPSSCQEKQDAEARAVTSSCDVSSDDGSKASVALALRSYGQRVRRALQEEKNDRMSRKALGLKFAPAGRNEAESKDSCSEAQLRCELKGGAKQAADGAASGAKLVPLLERDIAEDSDGEEVRLCCQCSLPLGKFAYAADDGEGAHVHAECLAQLLLRDLKVEDKARLESEAKKKKQRREQYNIGWSPSRVPKNEDAAAKLLGNSGLPIPKGMCCIKYDEASHSISVVPTLEPATAVNLEYLSLALEVRRRDGVEPTFSLEPLLGSDSASRESWLQVKRYGPEWLGGTSIGEVMFQADYHLKELSMGEHPQPVVGMRSCFDFSEAEEQGKEWRAREWFIVSDCEVFLTNDDVLLPYVKMGIEAREQAKDDMGELVDLAVTRPDHPLVKYAEEFTHYFDLIAERKSSLYHLRNLAKASVLAKFLWEMELKLEDEWFRLGSITKVPENLQIPQLWNERAYSDIRTKDGAIIYTEKGDGTSSMKGVYGGVTFGIDDFRFTEHPQVSAEPVIGVTSKPGTAIPRLGRGVASLRTVEPTFRPLAQVARPEGAVVPVLPPTAPPRAVQPAAGEEIVPTTQAWYPRRPRVSRGPRPKRAGLSAIAPITSISQASLAGVDLGLDQFNLSEPVKTDESGTGAPEGVDVMSVPLFGNDFFNNLKEDGASAFEEQERELLASVFNPALSDRRAEGDLFTPPDTSYDRVRTLRDLLREEAAVRQERMSHFLSPSFEVADPGPLFPFSWKSLHEIQPAGSQQGKPTSASRTLQERPEYLEKADLILDALKSATPSFDRSAEDAVRFRIYQLGSLEVRTTKSPDSPERLGVVFAVRSRVSEEKESTAMMPLDDSEHLSKLTMYVERNHKEARQGVSGQRKAEPCHFYVVAETEQGQRMVTELTRDALLELKENPLGLDDRNSLAKVLASSCPQAGALTVRALREHVRQLVDRQPSQGRASQSMRKRFARGALALAERSAAESEF